MKLEQLTAELCKSQEFRDAYRELEPELEVARQILRIRIETGLTQEELAKKAGTRQATVSRLENGVAHPSLSFLKRIAKAVGARLKVEFEHPALETDAKPEAVVERPGYVQVVSIPQSDAHRTPSYAATWSGQHRYSHTLSMSAPTISCEEGARYSMRTGAA
jgi:transcriptional regulator with XRE-family HTH domain